MNTTDTLLDLGLILFIVAFVKYLEFNPLLEFALLVIGIIYGATKIVYTIFQLYYLIKNKGK
ncbi:MAG: hypothetical protein FVQ77_10815 [Cytophagales bacterium]|nr:hypothetical protein [Cytophagales bacterium]